MTEAPNLKVEYDKSSKSLTISTSEGPWTRSMTLQGEGLVEKLIEALKPLIEKPRLQCVCDPMHDAPSTRTSDPHPKEKDR